MWSVKAQRTLKTGRGEENSASNKRAGVFTQFNTQLFLLLPPVELLWHREVVLQRSRSWNNQDLWEGWQLPTLSIRQPRGSLFWEEPDAFRGGVQPQCGLWPRSGHPFSLLPNEAGITPFQTKVPPCECVQQPQQGNSGHSWNME